MEDNLTGRQPHRKMTSQENDLTERRTHRKTTFNREKTSQEDSLTGDNLTGR